VAFPDERQQVMLAEAVEVDVAKDDHLAILDSKERIVEDCLDVAVIPAREEPQRILDAPRRLAQSFAIRVLSELGQQLADRVLHVGILSCGCAAWRAAGRSGCALSTTR